MRSNIVASRGTFCGFQALTVGSAAAASLTVPTGALYALVSVDADATSADTSKVVRFIEGETPTATAGHSLADGSFIEFFSSNIHAVKFIGIEAGKSHKLQVSYYF